MAEQNPQLGLTALGVAALTIIGVLIPSLLEPYFIVTAGSIVALGIIAVGLHQNRLSATAGGSVLALAVGFYFWSPWWHGLFYGMLYKSPGVLQWLIVGGLIALAGVAWGGYRMSDGNSDSGTGPTVLVVGGAAIAIIGFLFVGWFVGGIYAQEHMSHQVQGEVENVETLPEVDNDNPRALPEAVARNYAQNSLQTPRYHLAGGDITVINGTPHWSYSLAPDGGYNSWRIKQDGAVYVNMTTQDKDVDVARGQFKYGQGMAVFDDYLWQLKRNDYNHDYREPFVVKHEGELYMAVPYVDYNHHFRALPVPQVYSTPEFGGVKIISQDGTIEDLSPQEARNDPRLEGQNFYPYDLARFKVNSMRYKHGALNKWFTHKDQLQLAHVPGQGNNQPFTVMTEENGITYFLAAEPWGEQTHGVYQVWTVDARTGEMERVTYGMDESLLGPAKATRFVRQEHPNYQWVSQGEGSSGNIETSEPLPVVVEGTLYWQVFVVPTDSAGVAQVSYVNAETGAVTSVQTNGQIKAFLQGRTVDGVDVGANQNNTDSTSGASLVITVEYPDGSTKTITVPEGSTVSVRHANNSTATNATASG